MQCLQPTQGVKCLSAACKIVRHIRYGILTRHSAGAGYVAVVNRIACAASSSFISTGQHTRMVTVCDHATAT